MKNRIPAAILALLFPVSGVLAQHIPERLLYRRTDNIPSDNFGGALPSNTDLVAPFGVPDNVATSLVTTINLDSEVAPGPGINLFGDDFDLAFTFQFYDADGAFAFTENFDDYVRIVVRPIVSEKDLTPSGLPKEHTDFGWNSRTYANFDFGAGGWFGAQIWFTEDRGGAGGTGDLAFGYANSSSASLRDFGGIGYARISSLSRGSEAVFDQSPSGKRWGSFLYRFNPAVDTDADGLPDGYEEIFFPGNLGELQEGGDFDNDGVDDITEYEDQTDPTVADGDSDGLNDGEEKAAGTSPFVNDTDSDGLLDGVETGTGRFVSPQDTGSDPLVMDTDNDGFEDGLEIELGSDPNNPESRPAIDPSLLIGLDVTKLNLADGSLVTFVRNLGAAGNFSTVAGEIRTTSHPANDNPSRSIQGLQFLGGDKMASSNAQQSTPLQGNRSYTGMAWVWNPSLGAGETIVAWARRDGPVATNGGLMQGFGNSSAISHWGTGANDNPNVPDMGWGPPDDGSDIEITEGRWSHLAWVWDGSVNKVYINGELSNSKSHIALNPHITFTNGSPTVFAIGAQNGGRDAASAPFGFSGTIARVTLDDVARTDGYIKLAFRRDRSFFYDGFDVDIDTDEDGLPDGYEELFFPEDLSQLGEGDYDRDGESDQQEFLTGTNPTLADEDDDGSDDGAERINGTDPLDPDTDDDGLLDGVETNTGTFAGPDNTGTDPLNRDTDGDLRADGLEVEFNSDPTDAASVPPLLIIPPSFVPINELDEGFECYGPDYSRTGLDYQENHYQQDVIFNDQPLGNYLVHVLGSPAPLRTRTVVEPLASHGPGRGIISQRNRPYPDGGGNHFTVRYNGYLDMSSYQPGRYTIHLAADDTNYFIMDTADGQVTGQHACCDENYTIPFTMTVPGVFPFDNVFGEQSGGDWVDMGISGPGIPGIVALGDIANGSPPVYPISQNQADVDEDGLIDCWEKSWSGIADLNALSGNGDFDQDGLSESAEYLYGTDPTNPDMDNDNSLDGREIESGTDPFDPDSDNDGLLDGVETGTGTFISADNTGTNPLESDSDDDRLGDRLEAELALTLEYDPNIDDRNSDFDGDGLALLEELQRGSDYLNPDTDGDGSLDGNEVARGTNVLSSDTDGDGLLDGVETGTGVFAGSEDTGTDPLSEDTDGDGFLDSVEVALGSIPVDETSLPPYRQVQPSFVPINALGPACYAPDFTQPGLTYQIREFAGSVINVGADHYLIHTSDSPEPDSVGDSIVPWASHGAGGTIISRRNSSFPFGSAGSGNFTVRLNGYLDLRNAQPGEYKFHVAGDDSTYLVFDAGEGDRITIDEPLCCASNTTVPFEMDMPGLYPFDFVLGVVNAPGWYDLGISGPGIDGIVALGDEERGSPPVYPVVADRTDEDRDLLPDCWEIFWTRSNDLTILSRDGDLDGDGLTEFREFLTSLNPTSVDTDDDGLEDGAETNTGVFIDLQDTGSNPALRDSDGDGLDDGFEVTYRVLLYDPNVDNSDSDYDADGLSLREEIQLGTDILRPDTDGDGLDDGPETLAGTNPLVVDTDGDGLKDGVETNSGIFVGSDDTGSDPLRADTDGDGLSDKQESGTGIFVNADNTGTSPVTPDSDQDGLDDFVESQNSDDPYDPNVDDQVSDFDEDGLFLRDELAAGTSYTDADTDGDGLLDGEEISRATDPLAPDTDGDGLSDSIESGSGVFVDSSDTGTNPLSPDTDSDGLSDGAETNTGQFVSLNETGTSPLAADTDGDGLPDLYEMTEAEGIYDPNADDSESDFDEDGLVLSLEIVRGTDFLNPDTDGDGLLDGVETNTGEFLNSGDTGTDPLSNDSDEDGLGDEVESNSGTFVDAEDTGSSPLNPDSDGDGLPDLYEAADAADPYDPNVDDSNSDFDEDGLILSAELARSTDFLSADSDGDGLADGVETNTGEFIDPSDTGTNPLEQDTDQDGLSDFIEVSATNGGYDPTTDDSERDPDGDGLSLRLELAFGTDYLLADTDSDGSLDGEEIAKDTDPRDQDSDDDGLLDGVETGTGVFVDQNDAGTDPLDDDTDDDNLSDSDELVLGTNPLSKDSDGDGWEDDVEVDSGTDPTNPADFPALDPDLVIGLDATSRNNPDGLVIRRISNSGSAGNLSSIVGELETTSHPANANSEVLIKGYAFSGDKVKSDATLLEAGLEGNQPFTIEAWVWNSSLRAQEILVGWGRQGAGSGAVMHFSHGSNANYGAAGHAGFGLGWSAPARTDSTGKWSHVVYTYDENGDQRLFLNGEPDNARIGSNVNFNPAATFTSGDSVHVYLGAGNNATTENFTVSPFQGTMARLSMLKRALTPEKIREKYVQEARYFVLGFRQLDLDGDQIPDDYEEFYFPGNLDALGSPDGSSADFDADGLDDLEEYNLGTNPVEADGDEDDLLDGAEIEFGTDPADPDSDGDGLPDGLEVSLGTSPILPDSDGDGCPDGVEVTTEGRNPVQADTFPENRTSYRQDFNGYADGVTDLCDGSQIGSTPLTLASVQSNQLRLKEDPFNPSWGSFRMPSLRGSSGGWNMTFSYILQDTGGEAPGDGFSIAYGAIPPFTNTTAAATSNSRHGLAEESWGRDIEWLSLEIDTHGNDRGINVATNTTFHPDLFYRSATVLRSGETRSGQVNLSWDGSSKTISARITGLSPTVEIIDLPVPDFNPDDTYIWAISTKNVFSSETLIVDDVLVTTEAVDPYQLSFSSEDGGSSLQVQWNSYAGEFYTLVSSADPGAEGPPENWRPVDGFADIQGTPPLNMIRVQIPEDKSRLYRLLLSPPPPALSDDFENGEGGWISLVNNEVQDTKWELGTPNGTTGPRSGADGSSAAWSTNLGNYNPGADVTLRSPAVDLNGAASPSVNFRAFRDGDGVGDLAEVRFVRARDGVLLGAPLPIDMSVFDRQYVPLSFPIQLESLADELFIEIRFTSSPNPPFFSGLTIDNFEVLRETPQP